MIYYYCKMNIDQQLEFIKDNLAEIIGETELVEKLKQDLALVLKSNIEVEIIDLTKI